MKNEIVENVTAKVGSPEIEELETTQRDPFDPSNLRLSQNFHELVGVKKALTAVPVRKPRPQDYFRVHPGEEMCLETALLELKEDRETYLVSRAIWSELGGEIIPKVLFTTMNRQGVVALWPIRLPGEDGRHNPWHRSALEAAELAKRRWIRLVANMSLGAYEIYEAVAPLPDPEWPDVSFQELLSVAFKDNYIEGLDHPVLKLFRGEL